MGQEIEQSSFTPEDHSAFSAQLREETKILKRWFDTRSFHHADGLSAGLELEGWLVDANHLPAPCNDEFLQALNDPDVGAELSKFNFELNAPPRSLRDRVFSETHDDIAATWRGCEAAAESIGLKPVAIGILPTVREDMLQPDWMSESNRYHALNNEILTRRAQKPLHVVIEGLETLDRSFNHIMLEAACTSLQVHLKCNQEDAVRFYNAAVLAAAPLVAATANSPFLFGCSLWAETRVPAFEQITAMEGFHDAHGRNVGRVTLGTGYLRHSFLELFMENLSYSTLLPARQEMTDRLPHLRLQNGTIWRWVRPILGFEADGVPHLRLEHRVMAAGPSLVDTVANLALCHGLVLALGRMAEPPESETPFEDARANFYACAREGLNARVRWAGRTVDVQSLLLDQLAPAAQAALVQEGVDRHDVEELFSGVLHPRLTTGRTGAAWQRSFMDCSNGNFQALTERYVTLQASGAPVHEWPV